MVRESGPPVDQILVRKLGGWNLEPIDGWWERSTDEQRDLVRQGRVKFLAVGVDVPVRDALQSLRPNPTNGAAVPTTTPPVASAAAVVPPTPDRSAPPSPVPSITIPLPGRSLPRARYRRSIGDGKRWQIARLTRDGSEPLDGRWRRPVGAYRWDSDHGLVLLAHDLACDAIDLDPRDEIPEPLRTGEVSQLFAPWLNRHQGDRPWEITAEEIRWWLHDHQFLAFAGD